jgi:hypothetical protein
LSIRSKEFSVYKVEILDPSDFSANHGRLWKVDGLLGSMVSRWASRDTTYARLLGGVYVCCTFGVAPPAEGAV